MNGVELETTIHEVEACINSRPLTFVSDSCESREPLTPSHFLLGHSHGYFAHEPADLRPDSPEHLAESYMMQKAAKQRFWDCWSTEYVRNLPPFTGHVSRNKLKVGSVVILQEEMTSRIHWPLAVVTKVFPGKDGIVRSVEVKTQNNILTRSIQRVHSLELCDPNWESPAAEKVETSDQPVFVSSEVDADVVAPVEDQVIVSKDPDPEELVVPNVIMEPPPYVTKSGRAVEEDAVRLLMH